MHLTDDDLAALTADPAPGGSERTRIDRHVASCIECAERLAATLRFDGLLADEETWEIVDETKSRRASSSLHAFAERIRAEDEEARRLLDRAKVLNSPYKLVWTGLHRWRRFRTGGVVRVLTREAHAACEQDPLHARNLADAAIAIAEALPANLYPASGVEHLRGTAWKERANACRYKGEFKEALDALDRAERAFRRLLCPDLHLAIVNFVRATVQFKLDQHENALSLSRDAAREFARLGETLRWAHAQLVVGGVLFECAQFAAAREEFARTLDAVEMLGDLALRARVESNLANCAIELGDFGEAGIRLCTALPLFAGLGLPTEVVRTGWTTGCLALRAGNAVDAERRLRAARDEMVRLKMDSDAAKITLDLVDALLVLGDTREAPALLSDALRQFQDAGQLSSVLTATAYLRELAVAGRLTRELVDLVRRFIARAEQRPDLLFVPPPPR